MSTSRHDREILRDLGERIAEIAALPIHQEKIGLWKALNSLQPVRPMVTIDQVCWNEMEADGELELQSEDPFCRSIETRLRRTLYSWRHMPVDMVVEPVLEFPKMIHGLGFGVKTVEKTAAVDPRNDVVGHYYIDQIKTVEDLEKIQTPDPVLDEEATAATEARAREIFDGILTIRMQGQFPTFAVWDWIAQWRGIEDLLYDLVDRPDFTHQIMARITDAALTMLDRLEERGLLGHNQRLIHCTGAYTDELPASGFDPERPFARDLWTCGMAQIFSSVSPATHQTFELDYANRWYARFGIVYYGCCEPLDDKMDIVKKVPNVRKVSMSPWVDVEKGAECIGKDLVFSRKPSPALLAVEDWDPVAVEKDLGETLDACKRHSCPVELILKDISTVRYEPQRLWEWADVAMRVTGA